MKRKYFILTIIISLFFLLSSINVMSVHAMNDNFIDKQTTIKDEVINRVKEFYKIEQGNRITINNIRTLLQDIDDLFIKDRLRNRQKEQKINMEKEKGK